MSIPLTSRSYAEFRNLRRRQAPARGLGAHWTILGSDVLFAALDMSGVQSGQLLGRMGLAGDPARPRDRSPLFFRLLPQLPSCGFIVARLGVVEIRCGSDFIYSKERHRPLLVIPGVSRPSSSSIRHGAFDSHKSAMSSRCPSSPAWTRSSSVRERDARRDR